MSCIVSRGVGSCIPVTCDDGAVVVIQNVVGVSFLDV